MAGLTRTPTCKPDPVNTLPCEIEIAFSVRPFGSVIQVEHRLRGDIEFQATAAPIHPNEVAGSVPAPTPQSRSAKRIVDVYSGLKGSTAIVRTFSISRVAGGNPEAASILVTVSDFDTGQIADSDSNRATFRIKLTP